ENIVIAGESAGGYYITYVASCLNDKSILDALGIDFKHFGKAKINALVSICGCYDLGRLTDVNKEQSTFPDMKKMVPTFLGKTLEETREYLKTDNAKYCSPKITDEFPPTYAVWSTNDKLRFETFDLCADLDKLGVPNKQYKADGIIGNHAWAIMPIFKKSRACFEDAYKFVKEYIEM
ncbi:MAG: alpha/beta hydrolase fold domain-containing protein, partial [Clostridia bacterium]|nr:alpha/beta hydrolase fold domain-containing protein [Clostridia bacterium]